MAYPLIINIDVPAILSILLQEPRNNSSLANPIHSHVAKWKYIIISIISRCRSFGQCMQLQDSGSPPYVRVLECCRCVADSLIVVDRS